MPTSTQRTASGSADIPNKALEKPKRKRGTVNRDIIMNVASVMFRERGYDRTSLDDIAKALQITKPSLYYHFSSKEEILLAGIETGYKLFCQWLEERDKIGESGKNRVAIFVTAYVELLKDNVMSLLVSDERVMSETSKTQYRGYKRLLQKELMERLIAGQKDGSLREMDPRALSFSIFGMVNWMVNWPASDLSQPVDAIANQFLTQLFGGIATPN